jgi:hypothetical protein
MKTKWSPLLVGVYAWLTAIFFGAVLMDVLYASFLAQQVDMSKIIPVFSDISDMLLRIGFILVLSAFAAIASSWSFPKARNFLIASLFIYSFEFTLPMLFPYLKTSQGPFWIRLFLVGTATLLAFIGQFYRYEQD